MRKVQKPWGYEIIFAETKNYAGKILHINRGSRLSLQYHKIKEETLYVLSGKIFLETKPTVDSPEFTKKEILPGQSFHIPPGLLHRFTSLEDCDLIEVSTPHLMDVVRVEDDYGREGTSEP